MEVLCYQPVVLRLLQDPLHSTVIQEPKELLLTWVITPNYRDYQTEKLFSNLFIKVNRDFPGGPVVKTALPMQGVWV